MGNCNPGYYGIPLGGCFPCPTGTYNPVENGECLTCPVNSICSSTGTVNFSCIPGYYGTTTSCVFCKNGTYQPSYGQTTCLDCPQNANCTSTSYQCDQGYYQTPDNLACSFRYISKASSSFTALPVSVTLPVLTNSTASPPSNSTTSSPTSTDLSNPTTSLHEWLSTIPLDENSVRTTTIVPTTSSCSSSPGCDLNKKYRSQPTSHSFLSLFTIIIMLVAFVSSILIGFVLGFTLCRTHHIRTELEAHTGQSSRAS